MKFRAPQLLCICGLVCGSIACGAGHPTITRITVSPATATSPITPPSDVQYTATATFTNNTSRDLTVADGLTWSSSNDTTASINDTGSAACKGIGQVTITATAPADLNLTVNNGINNTSPNVTGTAQLNCLPSP
jgi:Bacterial Ig-like domain (group 2)